MTSPLWLQFPCALFVTCGFCIIFNVPARKIPLCLIVGSVSWMSYEIFLYFALSPVLAAFIASCLVWLLSNIFARAFKETSTMFIIPGIICLVPGSGAYYSMLAIHRCRTSVHGIHHRCLPAADKKAAGKVKILKP